MLGACMIGASSWACTGAVKPSKPERRPPAPAVKPTAAKPRRGKGGGRMPVPAPMRLWCLHRDRWRCTRCGSANELEMHHVIEAFMGGLDDVDNLDTLCHPCHMAWTHAPLPEPYTYEQWKATPPGHMFESLVAHATSDEGLPVLMQLQGASALELVDVMQRLVKQRLEAP